MKKNYKKPLRLKELAARSDSEIDYSDIPELDDDFWKNGKLTPPRIKPNVTLRCRGICSFQADKPKKAMLAK